MANRNTLHRKALGDFQRYLVERGEELLPIKSEWEVLRWRAPAGRPMPIVFDRLRGDHLSVNDAAMPYVQAFLEAKKCASPAATAEEPTDIETTQEVAHHAGIPPWEL